jgi:hypothetical protein
MVAMAVLLLLQVPAGVMLASVVVALAQNVVDPVIMLGNELMVTIAVLKQPPARV